MKVTCSLLLLSACFMLAYGAVRKPHIIFIMADDYGWANIGYHNNNESNSAREIVTPNLDQLNAEGIELDRHYVYKFCSPTRCSFLSGRNPIHVNAYNIPHSFLILYIVFDVILHLERNYNPANNISGYAGIPINMTVIASKMKQGGYATHYTGKWDGGWATRYHTPIHRGFDSGFGYFQHANNYWTYKSGCAYDLWNNSGPGIGLTNPKYCSQQNQSGCVYEDDLFVEHVVREIDAHNTSKPLFYYFATHGVHAPLEVPMSYYDKFPFINDNKRRLYAAMVNHLDDTVGKVIAKIKEKGMWNDTLIVFSSDNGGPLGNSNNYPLKGGKTSNWEGGIRVNAFVSGGYLPTALRGTKSEDFSDWYATFSAFAGVDPTDTVAAAADLPPIDSYNMWPMLSGANKTNPRTEIPIGIDNGGNGNKISVQGIIVPPYKLLLNVVPESFWQGPLYPNTSTNFAAQSQMKTNCGATGCLFNIMTDPTEHHDIASENPAIAQRLLDRINHYEATVFNVDRGPEDPEVCIVAKDKYSGFFGPWVNPIFS